MNNLAGTSHSLRVLILSDDHLARAGLAALLDAEEAVDVVGSYEGGASLAEAVAIYQPDAILWDMGWDLADSLEQLLTQTQEGESDEEGGSDDELLSDDHLGKEAAALVPILALIAEPEQSRAIPRGSVQGLLMRNVSADQLTNGLSAVVAGLLIFSPEVAPQFVTDEATFVEELIEPLTPRELEILGLITEGLANKAIARQLNISDHTVKFHTTSLYGKLGVSSRTEAVVRATRLGLILL